jgi:hypothetical protein
MRRGAGAGAPLARAQHVVEQEEGEALGVRRAERGARLARGRDARQPAAPGQCGARRQRVAAQVALHRVQLGSQHGLVRALQAQRLRGRRGARGLGRGGAGVRRCRGRASEVRCCRCAA